MSYEDEVRAVNEEERTRLKAALKEAERLEPDLLKRQAKATDAAHKLASKDFDAPTSEKEAELLDEGRRVGLQLTSVWRTINTCRKKLAALDDPFEFERRVLELSQKRQRFSRLRQQGGDMADRPSRAASSKAEVPDAVANRIVADIKKGAGVQLLSKELAKEKAEPYKEGWDRSKVAAVVKKKTGLSMAELRKQNPLAVRTSSPRKSSGDRAASKNGKKKSASRSKSRATGGAKKSASGKKSSATGISKSAQASGTSRGGTGRRPSKASSKNSAASKKKTAARKRRKK